MVSAGVTAGAFERVSQRQISASDELAITKADLEFLVIPPPSGIVDGYQEIVFLTDPIPLRAGNTTGGHDGEVDLIEINDGYHVGKRNATEVLIVNSVFGRTNDYIGTYTKTNAGHTISHFEGIFDSGSHGVSGVSLAELELYFGSLTIQDFELRGDSSFLLSGTKFNLAPPSIQNVVQISQTSASPMPSTIQVATTAGFPDSGYIFHNTNGVIDTQGYTWTQYTYVDGVQDLETTAEKKFGDRSVFLDVNAGSANLGSKIGAPIGTHFGTGDFTIDFWVKKEVVNQGNSSAGLLNYSSNLLSGASWNNSSGFGNWFKPNFGFSIYIVGANLSTLTDVVLWNGADGSTTNCGKLTTNWTHFAIVRSSGFIKVFIDGVEKASKPNTQDYTQAGAIAAGNAWGTGGGAMLNIGDNNISTGLDTFNGYIDEIHTSNIARYTSNFTPPTVRQQPDQYTTSFDNFDYPVQAYSGVVKYTGKTANTFTGCTVQRGSNQIASGSEIIPIDIV